MAAGFVTAVSLIGGEKRQEMRPYRRRVPQSREQIMTTEITPEDRARREKARLRSERARRARGVQPRPKAKQPWLAAGISRSTWYRRHKKAHEQAAAVLAVTMRRAALDRMEWQLTRLRADLARATRFASEGAAILGEPAAMATPFYAALHAI
jgi:hypothetical protein